MRFSNIAIALAGVYTIGALCTFSACATPLHADDALDAGATDAGAPIPVAKGCLPFHDITNVSAVRGGVHTLTDSSGVSVAIVDDATVAGADVPALAFELTSMTIDDCVASAAFAYGANGAPTSALSPPSLGPLASVNVNGTAWFYFSQAFTGIGVAPQDLTNDLFSSSGSLLFTADRPAYGTAAFVSDGNVYAYGCMSARFLDGDCYVARVSPASLSDESQYTYYTGGGQWSPRIDDAWPTTSGATQVDIAYLADRNLWLMIYAPPLGNTITARIGVAPEGPWSAPTEIATCDLQDPDMFCTELHAHAAITTPSGTIAISYAVASLSSDVAQRQAADPDAWWPRLVAIPVPKFP